MLSHLFTVRATGLSDVRDKAGLRHESSLAIRDMIGVFVTSGGKRVSVSISRFLYALTRVASMTAGYRSEMSINAAI